MGWGHDEQLTHQVSVWVCNDRDYFDKAKQLAGTCRYNSYYMNNPDPVRQYAPLGEWLTEQIAYPLTAATRQVRYAVSDKDLDERIDWAQVADDLLTE